MKKILFHSLILLFITPAFTLAQTSPLINSGSNINRVDIASPPQETQPVVVKEVTSNIEKKVECPENQYCLLEPLPNIPGITQERNCIIGNGTMLQCISFTTFVEYTFKFMIALAVFLATLMVIYGGFEYIISEVPYVKGEGKKRIINAFLGLSAALLSYLILQTIDPRLVQINTQIEPICGPEAKTTVGSTCYKGGLFDFQQKFSQHLQQITRSERDKVYSDQQKIDTLSQTIQEMEQKKELGILTEEEQKTLEKLKQERTGVTNSQLGSISRALGAKQFQIIVNTLDSNIKNSNNPNAEKVIAGAEEVLFGRNGQYEQTLKQLKGAEDREQYAIAKIYQKFYWEQIAEEKRLSQALTSFYSNTNGTVLTFINSSWFIKAPPDTRLKPYSAYYKNQDVTYRQFLKDYVEIHNNPEKNPDLKTDLEQYKTHPEIQKEYLEIIETRNNKIQQYISVY